LIDKPQGQLRFNIIRRAEELGFGTEFNGEITIGHEKGLLAKGPMIAPQVRSAER